MTTTLFTPAAVTSAYLKMGLLGFQGSGKTKTAAKTAIGLVNHMKKLNLSAAGKPVFFIDSETGSDWVIPDFQAAGIPIQTAKTRAFSDLVSAVNIAGKDGSVLLIDSITHFWRELCESYCRRKAQRFGVPSYRLQLQDWSYLKGDQGWGKFSDLFVNAPLHIILCGRAGYEFDMDMDEEGHKQLEKTGVKMKAEGEFGFEPSLLVYMELHQQLKGRKVAKQWRTATVLKDRAALIDGQSFKDPGFDDFFPHIERLNLGGEHLGVDTSRSSDHLVTTEKKDWSPVQRRICVDEIQTLLVLHVPGQTAADKKRKVELIRKHFNNASWTEIEEVMPLFDLRTGYDSLHTELEGKPSRYAPAVKSVYAPPVGAATAEAINDALPDHSAKPAEDTGETPKPVSVRERLLSDIPKLSSAHECLHWGLSMSDTFETLSKADKQAVGMALMAQQAKLVNGTGSVAS